MKQTDPNGMIHVLLGLRRDKKNFYKMKTRDAFFRTKLARLEIYIFYHCIVFALPAMLNSTPISEGMLAETIFVGF